VRVAAEDLNGDNGDNGVTWPTFAGGPGDAEIVTGAGPGGGPHVQVFDYRPAQTGGVTQIASFFAYDPGFTGGVYVAAGFVTLNVDLQRKRYGDIITGAGAGGGPHVKVFSLRRTVLPAFVYDPRHSFFAFDPSVTAGVRVGVSLRSSISYTPAFDQILTAPGPGVAPAEERGYMFGSGSPTLVQSYTPFDADFAGGLYVGSGEAVGRAV
jgi:hypothetical protein